MAKMTKSLSINQVQSWQDSLRVAAFDGISQADVKDIVQGIVKRAKEGSERDVRMVFDYLLGGKVGPQVVNQTLVVNGDPTESRPGSKSKVEEMAARHRNGKAIFNDADAD